MPAYFSMSMQMAREKLTSNYVQQMYTAITDYGYPFKSGFWVHKDATYEEIIQWNQTKLEQGFVLRPTQHVSENYMHILFDAPMYSQFRGFWMYFSDSLTFNLLIPEIDILNHEGGNMVIESKVAPIRGLAVHLWERKLVDIIQTSVELDAGFYSYSKVMSGEKIMAHPFAVISRDTLAMFDTSYFKEKELIEIGNNGVLIAGDNSLPHCLLDVSE